MGLREHNEETRAILYIYVGTRRAVSAVERNFLQFICGENNVFGKHFPQI